MHVLSLHALSKFSISWKLCTEASKRRDFRTRSTFWYIIYLAFVSIFFVHVHSFRTIAPYVHTTDILHGENVMILFHPTHHIVADSRSINVLCFTLVLECIHCTLDQRKQKQTICNKYHWELNQLMRTYIHTIRQTVLRKITLKQHLIRFHISELGMIWCM